jgi:predicted nuclease with TOPRIM domain
MKSRKIISDPLVTLSVLKKALAENNKVLLGRFDAVDKQFDAIDKRFNSIDKQFDIVGERLNRFDMRLGNLEDKVELLDKKIDIRTDEILEAVQKYVEIIVRDNFTHRPNLTPHNFAVSSK